MRRVQISGTELAVEDRGSGHSIVLVHGFPLDHRMWDNQLEELSAGFRVLAPDLRGFGQSRVTEGKVTMQQFARDLAEMLAALGIVEPVTVCGLSMGGYVAFQFWREFPERLASMILCDTRAKPDTPAQAADRLATADRVVREGAASLAEGMLPKLFSPATGRSRPDLIESVRQTVLATNPQGIAAAARGMAERPDMSGHLGDIGCPVLVVVGADDAISTPEEMRSIAGAIPGSRVAEIAGAGHMSPLEQPAAVNEAIRSWKSGLRK